MEPREIGRVTDARFGQDLNRPLSLHQHVLGQIHAAHTPRANVPQQFVLAEKKALVLLIEELVGVPARDQAGVNQMVSDNFGILWEFAAVLRLERSKGQTQLVFIRQSAALDIIDETLDA